jgi:hypothetical protein
VKKVLQIPLRGYGRRKVSGILSPGSSEWVAREAPVKPSRWKSKQEFVNLVKGAGSDPLDKLADTSQPAPGADPKGQSQTDSYKKRAKAKYLTNAFVKELITLDSPLKKSYINTLYCSSELKQDGDKITGKYCKNRWCMVCNRIRVGKCINGYMPELEKLTDPQFVTLTIPNVKKEALREATRGMILTFGAIYKKMHRWCKQNRIKLMGIRKMECTYNPNEDSYHPHFHFIIEGKTVAEKILAEWLERNPTAALAAQNIKPADVNSMKELFKYFTKVVTKRAIYIPAMDVIFRAIKGFKIYQPFGIRPVNDEPDDLEAVSIEINPDLLGWWKWKGMDWYHTKTGEPLTGFSDTVVIDQLLKNIIL